MGEPILGDQGSVSLLSLSSGARPRAYCGVDFPSKSSLRIGSHEITSLSYSQGCPLVIHSMLRRGLSRPVAVGPVWPLVADGVLRVVPRPADRS